MISQQEQDAGHPVRVRVVVASALGLAGSLVLAGVLGGCAGGSGSTSASGSAASATARAASVPDGFPAGVVLPEGTIVEQTTMQELGAPGWVLKFKVKGTLADAWAVETAALRDSGFSVVIQSDKVMRLAKDNVTVTVFYYTEDEYLTVSVVKR